MLTLQFPQRLFRILMLEGVCERILAGEDVLDWQVDVINALIDKYFSRS